MLVLSRKKDESIVINNDITIVVVEIRGDKVRLGVEAPKEVPVHRREVFEAIARGEPVPDSLQTKSANAKSANHVSHAVHAVQGDDHTATVPVPDHVTHPSGEQRPPA